MGGRKRGLVVWLLAFASIGLAVAPFAPILVSPANNTTAGSGDVILKWADSFDSDSDILFDNFDDISNWTVVNGYNFTQTNFRRDNSTSGMNWTLEDVGATLENSLYKIGLGLDVSEYEYFEFYLKSETNITFLLLELNDTHQNTSQWNLTESYCGELSFEEECHYIVNISNPTFANGTLNLSTVETIMFRSKTDSWGESLDNGTVFLDYLKFVNIENETRTYSVYTGNLDTNLTLNTSISLLNYTITPTSGRWYYWAVNISDSVSIAVSKIWRFFSNSEPYLIQPLPNTTIYLNSTHTIELSLYFNDIDGGTLNYSWVDVTNITITVDEDTDIASLTPDKAWEGSREITFTTNDSTNTVNSTFNLTVINLGPTQPVLISPLNGSRQIGNQNNLTWVSAFDPDMHYLLFGFDNVTGWNAGTSDLNVQTEFSRTTPVSGDTNSRGMNWTLSEVSDPTISYTFSPSLNISKYEYVKFYVHSTIRILI